MIEGDLVRAHQKLDAREQTTGTDMIREDGQEVLNHRGEGAFRVRLEGTEGKTTWILTVRLPQTTEATDAMIVAIDECLVRAAWSGTNTGVEDLGFQNTASSDRICWKISIYLLL